MPIQIAKGQARLPPELPSDPEFSQKLRLTLDDITRKVDEVADQSGGSKYDELEFTSAGPGEKVRIANKLGYVPNRMKVVCRKGTHNVGEPEDGPFADEDFIYVVTSAPKGAKFVVEFDKR